MGSVIHAIQDFGVWVEHIHGGCTSLCQPFDVGFNKPFKIMLGNIGSSGCWTMEEGVDQQRRVRLRIGSFMGATGYQQ